ncbi:MAG: DUF4214 domain-containing protein [Bdellovibrionales bacterium]|nr:DUF4214 domain-containing protein [Bdellovibrionales bacterium]
MGKERSHALAGGNGEGYSGKVYVAEIKGKFCDNNEPDSSEILAAVDGFYYLLRDNCTQLNPPPILPENEVIYSPQSHALQYQGLIYIDEEVLNGTVAIIPPAPVPPQVSPAPKPAPTPSPVPTTKPPVATPAPKPATASPPPATTPAVTPPTAPKSETTPQSLYLTHLFVDTFDRQPDSAGLSYWLSAYENRTHGCQSLTRAFLIAAENKTRSRALNGSATQKRAYINQLFRVVLWRSPDTAGLNFWNNQSTSGAMTITQIEEAFLTSDEFKSLCSKKGLRF